ncbi:MAG: DUF5665 domain-containing protein [Armatimonadetes bacterium]|nr:DUF5665 domain-containing protein [Armatimonadota bacterium]
MTQPTTEETLTPQYRDQKLDQLIQAVDRAYNRPRLMMWRSFVIGVMTALGATVGTAIIFTILIAILNSLGGVELFKPTVDRIQGLVIPKQYQPKDHAASVRELEKSRRTSLATQSKK